MRILLVEDDLEISRRLVARLTAAGFVVEHAPDAEAALDWPDASRFSALVVDLGLPGLSGVEFVVRWRERGLMTPILILTARGLADDRIEGLALGADDYLAKPFEPKELLLRIEAILRRTHARPARTGEPLTLGACAFDPSRGELTREGQLVRLTEGEVQLLRRLAQSTHTPVDRLELAGDTTDPSGRAVDIQVTRLRRKIESDPKTPRYLQTVRGVGYMLAPD